MTKQHTPLALYVAAFRRPRLPRSDAYKDGVGHGIDAEFFKERVQCPYLMGTAEADAWLAGVEEGRAIVESKYPSSKRS